MMISPDAPMAIDSLAALDAGRYVDDVLTVFTEGPALPRLDLHVVRTEHFDIWTDHGLVVRHRVRDDQIHNGLTTLIHEELFEPGWLSGRQIFERLFTGVVRTSRIDPLDAWSLFYVNSRRRLAQAIATSPAEDVVLGDFAAIYRHADRLVPHHATVLEVGSCFGFMAMHLARLPTRQVTATDVSTGTMRLVEAMAGRLHIPLRTAVCDAARLPGSDRSVDVVLVPHLLEHLEPDHGWSAIVEAMRVAEHRVVVAVPYEQEATVAYGHVRTIDRDDLQAWGRRATGWDWSVSDDHGGWLVLDRTS